MESINPISPELYIYVGIGILVLGIILGFRKTITVYRNYADLTRVFMLVLVPVGLYLLLGDKIQSHVFRNIIIGIEVALLIWIIFTTHEDNRNIFKTILAFITKIPLAVIFAIYMINLVSPKGSSGSGRRQGRGVAMIILLFLGPVLFGLVRDKSWSSKKEADE